MIAPQRNFGARSVRRGKIDDAKKLYAKFFVLSQLQVFAAENHLFAVFFFVAASTCQVTTIGRQYDWVKWDVAKVGVKLFYLMIFSVSFIMMKTEGVHTL